jgi:hypothetical protein
MLRRTWLLIDMPFAAKNMQQSTRYVLLLGVDGRASSLPVSLPVLLSGCEVFG